MFKSLKKRPEKVKEKLDFKLSFHATRVPPQGWDKLVISVIPYETGRAVAKTPRAVVKNGECHWPDSIIETTRLIYDTKTNVYEEKKYKFIVSSGSSRSGVLGEVTINLGEFASSKNPQEKGLPLRNCSTGTWLHVTVTCLTPRSTESGKGSDRAIKPGIDAADEEEDIASEEDDQDKLNKAANNGHLDIPRKPALDSPPLSPASPGARKLQQRNVSQSSLRYSSSSFDSLEVPSTPGANSFNEGVQGFPGENLSSSSSFTNLSEKLDRSRESIGNDSTSPAPSYGHNRTLSSSATSVGHQQVRQAERSQTNWGGNTEHTHVDYPEAAEVTIEDLQMEVTTSKRQALKLSGEVEDLNHKLEWNRQLNKEKEMEVSALMAERNGLKQEVEKLKLEKQDSVDREIGEDDARWAVEDAQRVIQELKEEIMLEKNTINSLNLQLQRTQECNMKLVSEIDDLLSAAKSIDTSRPSEGSLAQVESEWAEKLAAKEAEIQELQIMMGHLESRSSQMQRNTLPPTGGNNDGLVNGLQNMVKELQLAVEELEVEADRLTHENTELHAKLESSSLDLRIKSRLIDDLKADVSSQHWAPRSVPSSRHLDVGTDTAEEGRAQLLGKIASLQGELNRLKEETNQILYEKEEAENEIQRLQTENQELEKSINNSVGGEADSFGRVKDREVANNHLLQQLADTVTGLEEELQESQEESRLSRLHIEELEREILALTSSDHNNNSVELESLRRLLENEKLDKENIQRNADENTRVNQEHLDHALEESELLKDRLENLLIEKRTAESRASDLEVAKTVLEGKLAALEEEKMRISERVSGLELQLQYMTEERDLRQQEAGVVEEEKSYLLSEKERLQAALDSTTAKQQDLVRHLTQEIDEAIKECEIFKNSHHHLEQEVLRLQGELEEAHHDLREHTKVFENSRAVLEESFHAISRDHANAVAVSTALEAQVAQLQSDLEDMEMRSATEVKNMSMLKESEQHRAEKAEEALQQSALLQKEKAALEKRVAELELLLEDERASYVEEGYGRTSNGNGKSVRRLQDTANNGHQAFEDGKLKLLELDKIKKEHLEKESLLLNEIERLELVNEQLIQGTPDSDLQQLRMEFTRLQNQNAALNRSIKDLQSCLTTQNMLQSEVERLQEVNEKLDNRLQKYKASAAGSDMVERVVHLETELAEATEAITMYKSQLRSAFAEPQNVHAVALQRFGDVDTVVNDLVELRKRVKQLEGELRDMRDRYSTMSLRFAEVEVEREELVMTVRTLRNSAK